MVKHEWSQTQSVSHEIKSWHDIKKLIDNLCNSCLSAVWNLLTFEVTC